MAEKRYECTLDGFCDYRTSGVEMGLLDGSGPHFCLALDTKRRACGFAVEFQERKFILKGLLWSFKWVLIAMGVVALLAWLIWNVI